MSALQYNAEQHCYEGAHLVIGADIIVAAIQQLEERGYTAAVAREIALDEDS